MLHIVSGYISLFPDYTHCPGVTPSCYVGKRTNPGLHLAGGGGIQRPVVSVKCRLVLCYYCRQLHLFENGHTKRRLGLVNQVMLIMTFPNDTISGGIRPTAAHNTKTCVCDLHKHELISKAGEKHAKRTRARARKKLVLGLMAQ